MATITRRTLRDGARRWIVNYKVPSTGKQRRKTFSERRDAEIFAHATELARNAAVETAMIADRLADHVQDLTASFTDEQRARFQAALFAPHQAENTEA